jgi:hypothetical protein
MRLFGKLEADVCPTHGEEGFCEVCDGEEKERHLVTDLQERFGAETDEEKKNALKIELHAAREAAREGCVHGVEVGNCTECAIEAGIIKRSESEEDTPLMKLMGKTKEKRTPQNWIEALRSGDHPELEGLPHMDTQLAALENPRPIAPTYCPVSGGYHEREAPWKYRGTMALGEVWWPGQKPPREKCHLCGMWWDGAIMRDYGDAVAIFTPPKLSPTSSAAKAGRGWAGRATGSLARNLGFGN